MRLLGRPVLVNEINGFVSVKIIANNVLTKMPLCARLSLFKTNTRPGGTRNLERENMTRDQREAGLTQAEADAEISTCATEGCENSTEPCHAYCRACEEASYHQHIVDHPEDEWADMSLERKIEVCKTAGLSIFLARRGSDVWSYTSDHDKLSEAIADEVA
jgi:hypothetical protein